MKTVDKQVDSVDIFSYLIKRSFMRSGKVKAVATFTMVVVLSLVLMSHKAFASPLVIGNYTFSNAGTPTSISFVYNSSAPFVLTDLSNGFSCQVQGSPLFGGTTYGLLTSGQNFPNDCSSYYISNGWVSKLVSISNTDNGTVSFQLDSMQLAVSGFVGADTSSHFISLDPLNGSTVATSTTFGAEVYIAPADYATGTVLHVNFTNNTLQNGIGGSALDAFNSAFGGFTFPLVSGDNLISTSTVFFPTGQYNATYQVSIPSSIPFIGFLFSPTTLLASTSEFFVVAPTALDQAMASTSPGALISALTTGTTTTNLLDSCNIAQFSLGSCLLGILVPPTTVLNSDLTQLRDGVFSAFPIGYVIRFISILSLQVPTEPPALSYTFGTSSPSLLQGRTYSIQLYDYMGSSSPLWQAKTDDGQGKNIWDIIDPPITTLVSIMVLFVILNDLLGLAVKRELEFDSRTEEKSAIMGRSTSETINGSYYGRGNFKKRK